MRNIMLLLVLLSGANAAAYPDARCMFTCQRDGHAYSWCQERCEYDPMPQAQPTFGGAQPDPRCVQACQAAGFAYTLCQQRCR